MNKLLVILGPTATGKTDLALHLAEKFNGELVSCDSRQVYRGLDIGTGKLFGNGIKIWMYDVVSPKIQYTVADYDKDANRVIVDISIRGKLPIIVGGTGLYLKALLEGLESLAIPVDKKLRNKLEKLSLNQLQKKLQEVNILKWESMNKSDRQNPRRLVRAIELEVSPGRSSFDYFDCAQYRFAQDHLRGVAMDFNVLKIGLTAPREVLYKLVDDRVVLRIKQGMTQEAKKLHKKGLSFNRMRQLGLEYGVLADYLDKKIQSRNDLIKIIQHKIHGYVRRQITWFKKEKNIIWFDINDKDYPQNVEKIITKWYHQG